MKFLILGGGPAGLSFAARLKKNGISDFLVLEKENEAGGLCRTVQIDGAPFDFGGPHFTDVRNPEVVQFFFDYLPKDNWSEYDRNSKIMMPNGQIINSPIEANIWQMSQEDQIDYLESISKAGCNRNEPMPEKFVDWIHWKLGDKIAENYMLPYNQKIYGDNLNELGTYWLYKLPNVSFRETISSCIKRQFFGQQPCHAHFLYPEKLGSGEVWKLIAEDLGSNITYNSIIKSIDFNTNTVETEDGTSYQAEYIITSIPWAEFENISGMPEELLAKVRRLKHTSLELRYVRETIDTDASWLYCPDINLPFHRAMVRANLCPGAVGMGVETREERVSLFGDSYPSAYSYMNKYAYPLNTIGKPEIMKELLAFGHERNVYGVGRWGEHEHHNSDVVVEKMFDLADELSQR